MRRPELLWITVGGLGHLRPAPGTWGSLPPVLAAAALIAWGLDPAGTPWAYYPIMVVICLWGCAGCIVQGDRAEVRFGRKDPSEAVADETAGQAVTLLAVLPGTVGTAANAATMLVAAFLLFRVFDIIKPWPARGLQRIPGGWGILIDDLLAGVYAAAGVLIVGALLPR
jgi:phosphatidylglycerophosphatase A